MARRRDGAGRTDFWRAVLLKQQGSGLSIRGFCRRESISEPSFYWWRRELAQGNRAFGRHGQSALAKTGSSAKKRSPSARFVNVSLLTGAGMIELELSDGRRLRIPPGCDESTLATVLRVLESRSC